MTKHAKGSDSTGVNQPEQEPTEPKEEPTEPEEEPTEPEEEPTEPEEEPTEPDGEATGFPLGDVYVHNGPLMPPADRLLFDLVGQRPRSETCTIFLQTLGGVADVAYRMMRALQHGYEHITVVLWGPCKSAGTLMALGANTIVMFGEAELGPLDVQILTKDELMDRRSGLIPQAAFARLTVDAIDAFREMYIELKLRGNMATKTAAATAAELTVGMFAPIFGQVDPLQVGEFYNANLVAGQYGERLADWGGNTLPETLGRLLGGYVTHSFVIDRTEAQGLFKQVRNPTDMEREIVAMIRGEDAFVGTNRLAFNAAADQGDCHGQEEERPDEPPLHAEAADSNPDQSGEGAGEPDRASGPVSKRRKAKAKAPGS